MPPIRTSSQIINRRGSVAIAAVVLAFAALAGRLIHIHVAEAAPILEHRDQQRSRTLALSGQRGQIVDARGRLLASSRERPSVYADPHLITEPDATAQQLAPILDREGPDIAAELTARPGARFRWLTRGVDDAQGDAISLLKLTGVRTMLEPDREYPHRDALANVLGFVGRDHSGLEGLERFYESTLKSTSGQFAALCDTGRRMLWSLPESSSAPANGFHLVLTIDVMIQRLLDQGLDAALGEFEAERGVGILLDPNTGAVLAMSSRPSFDPNRPQAFDGDLRRNRCITDPVEPGSVFKPFIMAAALAENLTHPDDRIDCGDGTHRFGKRLIRDTHPNGVLTATQIIVESSNIGMGMIAARLGNGRIHHYLSQFGFGQMLGIDLPGESAGLFPPLREWRSYSTQSVAIGQEIAVTPLQLISAMAAMVNGGTLYEPFVVRALIDPDTGAVHEREPRVIRTVLDAKTSQAVARMMTAMVAETHHDVQSKRYTLMGKTGTAEMPYREDRRGYEPDAYLSSFMAAAPASAPQVVALIMIERPNRRIGYYGGRVAGPAVRNVVEGVLDYWQVPRNPSADDPDREPSARLVHAVVNDDEGFRMP